jgi:hypothetical protein
LTKVQRSEWVSCVFSIKNKQISDFLKGIRQERSVAVRDGRIRSEEGKLHIKFAEFVVLCEEIMFTLPPSIGLKPAS